MIYGHHLIAHFEWLTMQNVLCERNYRRCLTSVRFSMDNYSLWFLEQLRNNKFGVFGAFAQLFDLP